MYNKEGKDWLNTLLSMRRQVKVGVYQTNVRKRELKTCFACKRNERGLVINEDTAPPSQWHWRFEIDRMQSRFASNVGTMGPCQLARFWKKSLFIT